MRGVLIFSAPSGSGKTTILKTLFEKYSDRFGFSVSATNRLAREGEENGKAYYFMSTDEFRQKISNGEFLEWEEVYEGRYYGTLKSELQRIWSEGKIVVFDVDVLGGINIKSMLKEESLSIFIMPPSVKELERRLIDRATESNETILQRIGRAEMEISKSGEFDKVIVNDDLSCAILEVERVVLDYITNLK